MISNPNKYFAAALEFLIRIEKRCGQKELADCLGVSQPTISSYISGRTNASKQKKVKAAEFFKLSYDELLKVGDFYLKGSFDKQRKEDPSPTHPIMAALFDALEEKKVSLDASKIRQIATLMKRMLDEGIEDILNKDMVDLEHEKIIRNFKDKDTAKDFNHMLSELERIENDAYIELYGETAKAYKKALAKKNIRKEDDIGEKRALGE